MIKCYPRKESKKCNHFFFFAGIFYFFSETHRAVYVCEIVDKCCFISPLHSTHKVQGIKWVYYGMDFI